MKVDDLFNQANIIDMSFYNFAMQSQRHISLTLILSFLKLTKISACFSPF